ncbi:hypothetical protein AVEN_181209-1 [Araneus ventricosus]|uniref:Chitin-binding type-2 domain-containing protein n=1 Tax=Araneus ventricosus TaxID=182803 RepID=A0A4Y2FYM1_ARAVE|nr:hypothetical protein AVEN_181209-1 [Araneus ventricosus]
MDARYYFLVIFLIPLIGVVRSENEVENIEDSETGGRQLRDWPWGKKNKFVCPSLFGVFADILDCSAFYVCVGGIANRNTCKRMMQFDKYRKTCLPFIVAICDKGDDDGDKTTALPTTKGGGGETTKDKFTCPSIVGNFPHPDDCSKYYSCTFYVSSLKTCSGSELFDSDKKECRRAKNVKCGSRKRPSGDDDPTTALPTTKKDEEDKFTCPSLLGKFEHPTDCSKYYSCAIYIASVKTCPESELFDGVKKQCRPAKDVHCGTRQRPSDATTEEITTTPISTETPTPTEPETPPPTEPETTTPTPTEPEPITTTTTEEPTTTKRPKVTAPDTECDEDDVDCIIDDLGETPDWFVCPEDIGSYPHPSSKKLFIFCLNWKPSVKKCGQDLIFSEDLMTCVHPY